MSDQGDQSSGRSGSGGLPVVFIGVVALVLLTAFAVLAVWMMASADVEETTWARRVYVFGAVEAIVFAAVGWLFGREVHRGQAEAAQKDAQEAKADAAEARDTASAKSEEAAVARTKGQALASAVRGSTPPLSRSTTEAPAPGGEPATPGLRSLTDELFPSS